MLEELQALFLKLCKENPHITDEQVEQLSMRLIDSTDIGIVSSAIAEDFLPVVKHFIENGGDPYFTLHEGAINEEEDDDEVIDISNMLNIAAEKGAEDIINYLLDSNIFTVDQRASENSRTALHSAVRRNHIESVKVLLKNGANINAEFSYNQHGVMSPTLGQVITIIGHNEEDGTEVDFMEMAKLLIKHNVQIPNNIEQLCSAEIMQMFPTKRAIKDFLYNNVLNNENNNFIDIYKTSNTEVQEIWRSRMFKDELNKLADFMHKKFSNGEAIEYNEFAGLREYNSLPNPKKDVLKIFLEDKNFTNADFEKLDNYIKDHFFKISSIAKSLESSAFEVLDLTIIPMITQYLQFEDTSIKIAGAAINDDC